MGSEGALYKKKKSRGRKREQLTNSLSLKMADEVQILEIGSDPGSNGEKEIYRAGARRVNGVDPRRNGRRRMLGHAQKEKKLLGGDPQKLMQRAI